MERPLPLLEPTVSNGILNVAADVGRDRCSAYQRLVGVIFYMRRRYAFNYASEAKPVARFLEAGPLRPAENPGNPGAAVDDHREVERAPAELVCPQSVAAGYCQRSIAGH